jgi:crotonobetainyl-CoA:carnitine CoA-transferase CaiB-like acyl-CoA transferase
VYPCAGKDEWCAISVEQDSDWYGLTEALGRPDLDEDPRFATALGRMHNHDALDEIITAWTRDLTSEEAEKRLKAEGVVAERMRRAEGVIKAPDSGRIYHPVPGSEGRVLTATVPFTFSASAIAPVSAPSQLGAHSHDALRDWLSLSDAEIDALDRERALV